MKFGEWKLVVFAFIAGCCLTSFLSLFAQDTRTTLDVAGNPVSQYWRRPVSFLARARPPSDDTIGDHASRTAGGKVVATVKTTTPAVRMRSTTSESDITTSEVDTWQCCALAHDDVCCTGHEISKHGKPHTAAHPQTAVSERLTPCYCATRHPTPGGVYACIGVLTTGSHGVGPCSRSGSWGLLREVHPPERLCWLLLSSEVGHLLPENGRRCPASWPRPQPASSTRPGEGERVLRPCFTQLTTLLSRHWQSASRATVRHKR